MPWLGPHPRALPQVSRYPAVSGKDEALRGPEPSLVSQAICRGLDPLQRRPEPAQSPRGQQRVLLWVPLPGPATRPLTTQSTLYCHRTATLTLTSHVKDHTWLGGGKATAHPSDRAQTVLSLEPLLPALTGRLWGGPSCTQNTYVLKIPQERDL